jgi:MFS family permease
VFALTSLFAGTASDQFNRKNIISLSCLTWSVMTILQSKAENYGQLIPIRIVVGFSQAFFNPAAFTLIADTFPKEQVE